MRHFDIVHAADPRYLGGTSTALRGELLGAARWGLNCAVLPYLGPRSAVISGFEARTAALMAAENVPVLSADGAFTCDILLAHHPFVFEHLATRPIALRPKRVVCVLHHPLVDGSNQAQYDIEKVALSLQTSYAVPVVFAPISAIVRAQALRAGVSGQRLLRRDLYNVIDEAEWPERTRPAPRTRAVIGRHARADILKWPDTARDILAAYPADSTFDVRVLGEVSLPEGLRPPRNWTTLPFASDGIAEFLGGLDFYVYFHSKRWVEAFGLAVAEAMACGLVTILPRAFEPIFGPGAVYGEPGEVRGLLDHFMARPDEFARQSRAARRLILERYAVASYNQRIARLYEDLDLAPPPLGALPRALGAAAQAPAPLPPPARRRVLMVAGNGIGLGHITRLMAVARRLPAWIEPVFLTLSPGTALIREQGFSADYIPSHTKAGVTERSWTQMFALELMAAIDATGASLVLFDGNDPFPSIVKVMAQRKDVAWFWIQRGLWQPHQRLNPETQYLFDMVIQPGELAGREDGGATAELERVERVGPILMHDPGERAGKAEARALLGVVDDGRPLVGIQLGARQNFNMAPLRRALLETLAAMPVSTLEIENPLAAPQPGAVQSRRMFPVYPVSAAFDLMVTASGYNTFHENTFGGVPSIFVPNEAAEMDDQLLRAAYAQSAGLGLMLTVADAPRVQAALEAGLAPGFGQMVRHRAGQLSYRNGAQAVAKLIADFLLSVRTDRPLHQLLPRLRQFD